ncbi:O-antigen ligase family protein [Shinella sp. S4-D37]|uniref:O-antigen ligase family protein n=1 Tax=Shinella sp. S4-D37 TaxID=3161999 RepID=UPI00346551D2
MKAVFHRPLGRGTRSGITSIGHMADHLHLAVLLISFPGYPLVVAAASLIGLESSVISLVMRSVNVVLATALIVLCYNSRRNRSANTIICLFLIFWSAYIFRIFFDTLLFPAPLGKELSFYWIWAIGGCFLPMLGLALKPCGAKQADQYFRWFYLATLLTGILAIFSASGAMENDTYGLYETGRMRISDDRLNPISLGHFGAMLMVQSIWAIVFFRVWSGVYWKCILFFGFISGLYLLASANSRGPVVASLACIVVVVIFSPPRYKSLILLFSVFFGISIMYISIYLEDAHNISAFSRVFGGSPSQQAEQSLRPYLYSRALDVFAQNPWLGGALEDSVTLSYPHNVILESLMAVGLFFGGIIIFCFSSLLYYSFFFINYFIRSGWFCLIFIQYFIGSQFSGSIYGSTYLWCSVGLLISLSQGFIFIKGK